MAIDTQSMLFKMSPLSPIDLGGLQQASMERQRLQLARQQFEEQRKQNALDQQYRRDHEAAEMTRAKMADERQRAEAETRAAEQQAQRQAAIDAKNLADRRGAFEGMLKYRDAGDYEGMESAATQLNAVGGLAERLGQDANGLPTWRMEEDAEAARARDVAQGSQAAEGPAFAQSVDPDHAPRDEDTEARLAGLPAQDESVLSSLNRLNALGYDTLGARDPLSETRRGSTAPLSTEDAFNQATDASTMAEDTGEPLAEPDAPDLMGGVPKNVVDTGAMAAQSRSRLGPVMAEMAKAYPETGGYRESAEHSNAAALGLALPAGKTLEANAAMRSSADAAIRSEQQLAADAAKEKAKTDKDSTLSPEAVQRQKEKGFKRAKESFNNSSVKASLGAYRQALLVDSVLSDNDPNNDDLAINYMMNLNGQVGAQTEADALRVTGLERASVLKQIEQWVQEKASGGLNEDTRASMRRFAQALKARNKDTVHNWMSEVREQVHGNADSNVAAGYQEFLDTNTSPELRDDYIKDHPEDAEDDEDEEPEQGAAAPMRGTPVVATAKRLIAEGGDFLEALDAEAQAAGLNTDYMRRLVHGESGGKGDAANPNSSAKGIIQMIDEVAQGFVNPRTGEHFKDSAEFAALPRNEQLPIAMEYFKQKGLSEDSSPEDYALALAAPDYLGKKHGEDVVYAKGSKEHRINRPWWPPGGGDITADSIAAHYFGKGKKGEAKKSDEPKPAGKPGRDDASHAYLLE